MSSNVSDNPQWLQDLERELGLDDTPPPVEEATEDPALLDVIKNTEFTPKGWARVRELILRADEETDIDIFHRILRADKDEAMMFTAMIGLPYYLGKTIGYASEHLEKMATFVAASYVIAMNKGYQMGAADTREARNSRDE